MLVVLSIHDDFDDRERVPDPYALVIFDLVSRQHHWVDTTLIDPTHLLRNIPTYDFYWRQPSFEFDGDSNKLKVVLYFESHSSLFLTQPVAVFELEVTLPDFKTSVISSVQISSDRL